MRPFDSVILNADLPEYGIKAGTVGAIVDQPENVDNVFLVEFFDKEGHTLDVADVRADQITVTLPDFAEGEQVALLDDLPLHHLRRGQVGVIALRVGPGVYRVEFMGVDGAAYASAVLHAHQLMLLHWQPSAVSRRA